MECATLFLRLERSTKTSPGCHRCLLTDFQDFGAGKSEICRDSFYSKGKWFMAEVAVVEAEIELPPITHSLSSSGTQVNIHNHEIKSSNADNADISVRV